MKHTDEELEKLLGEIPQATENSLHVEGLAPVGASPVPCSRKDECGDCCHSPSLVAAMAGTVKEVTPLKFTSNMEEPMRRASLVATEQERPLASLGFTETHSHELPDESLITAFSSVNLEMNGSPRNPLQPAEEYRGNASVVGDSDAIKATLSLYNHIGSIGKIPPGNVMSAVTSSPAVSDASSAYRIYGNDGMMFVYANGQGASLVNNVCNVSSDASLHHAGGNTRRFPIASVVNGDSNNSLRDFPMNLNYNALDHDLGTKRLFHGGHVMDKCPSSVYDLQFSNLPVKPSASYVQPLHMGQTMHQDCSLQSVFSTQKACNMPLTLHKGSEDWQRVQQILSCHSQAMGCMPQYQHPLHAHAFPVTSFHTGRDQSYKSSHTTPMAMMDCRAQVYPRNVMKLSPQNVTNQNGGSCTFLTQGFCSKGDLCPVMHSYNRGRSRNTDLKLNSAQEKQFITPVKILSRDHSKASAILPMFFNDGKNEVPSAGIMHTENAFHPLNLVPAKPDGKSIGDSLVDLPGLDLCRSSEGQQSPQTKYRSLAEVEGHIHAVAKDQHGCRFLQRQFDEGGPEELEKIFLEIIDHVLELMTDPFGNYLVQKLLDVCNEEQRLQILEKTTKNEELINVSLNMHGTRAVQKLIETLSSSQQVSMVTASLRPGVVALIKDLNGNHVIQRCLQHLSNEDSQFIFEAATAHCVEIATHRHGCCVLQRCIDFSTGVPQQRLIGEIAANSLLLSQDPFGNYVVQYILDLGITWATKMVMDQLAGNYAYLSMQKFSSNVVEKCLKIADDDQRTCVIHELMEDSRLLDLLQDPFANYVIQSALVVSKGSLHASLVEAICPHTPFLRSSPYGKRILSRRNLKRS